MMHTYLAEFIGTAILILLGNGVVANVLLARTKGHGAGWVAVTTGWATAVFVAVVCVDGISGAHLNPAVTLGLALDGRFAWVDVLGYWTAQLGGAFFGAVLVFVLYRPHYDATDLPDTKLATFCTSPAIRATGANLAAETIGTFVLVFGILRASSGAALGSLGALPVTLIVYAVGTSLGGPTGYAINPARDLGPRLAHHVLPIRGKRDADWGYAWIPVCGPLVGAGCAFVIHRFLGA